MEAAPGMGPPMMTRVGGQVPALNYGQILHQTEQDQHQPANPQYPVNPQQPQQQPVQYTQPPPQQYYGGNPPQPPPPGMQPGSGMPHYNPNILPPQGGQPQINFEGSTPWAGMPGCSAAFESQGEGAATAGGYSTVGQEPAPPDMYAAPGQSMYAPQEHVQKGKMATLWQSYKDVIVVVLIVYVLLKYGLPQAKRLVPAFFSNFEASVPATAILAACVGGMYQTSKKII